MNIKLSDAWIIVDAKRGDPCPHCGAPFKDHRYDDRGAMTCGVTDQQLYEAGFLIPASVRLF